MHELVKRYIYDVTRRLPQKSRKDIEEELAGNISDMLAAKTEGRSVTDADVQEVLQSLGSPAKLARDYKGEQRALISGVYYDQYCFVLKIVLIAVAVGMGIAFGISTASRSAITPDGAALAVRAVELAAEFLAGMISALAQALGYVTLAFFLIERYQVKLDARAWRVSDLPPIPGKNALIKKSEPIVSIVFSIVFMLLINLAPQYIAVFVSTGGPAQAIPVFNLGAFYSVLPLINIAFLLGLAREILRVSIGRHTLKLGVATMFLNIAAMALVLPIFFSPSIWIPDFLSGISAAGWADAGFIATMGSILDVFYIAFPCILVFAYVLDTALSLYRGIRYGRQ